MITLCNHDRPVNSKIFHILVAYTCFNFNGEQIWNLLPIFKQQLIQAGNHYMEPL